MNALPRSPWRLTVEEYLAHEGVSDVRHEYVDGNIYALAGASQRHGEIVGSIYVHVWNAIRGGSCRAISKDMKVQVTEKIFYYPDIVVTCDPDDRDPLILRRPVFVAEVLSPTTSGIDRREKALMDLQLPSLLCYLIVDQEERWVERYWRPDGQSEWNYEIVVGRSVHISGIDLTLAVDEIYEGIEFDPAT